MAPTAPASWRVAIATTGGFTGLGAGSVVHASTDLHVAELSRIVAEAAPRSWQADYDSPRAGAADQVRYRLELNRDGHDSITSWSDPSFPRLPHDLRALFEAAWNLRR